MNFDIEPKPPFDFKLSAMIFSKDDPQIRRFENDKFWQVIRVNNKPVLVTLNSTGTIQRPKLAVDLQTNEKITQKEKTEAIEIINHIFNLELDLNQFFFDLKKDKIISKIAKRFKGLKCPNNATVFEGLVCSITEQQISMNVAFNIQRKLTKKFGDTLKLGNKIYCSFPTPVQLAIPKIEDIRSCGLSQRKAEYIRDISQLIAEKSLDLEKFHDYENAQDIIDELIEIRGIGVWTVELTIIRSMRRFDVVPADDLGLRRWVSHYYFNDKKVTGPEVRELAVRWGAWKGLAAFYFLILDQMSGNDDYRL